MSRAPLEVADIFHRYGNDYRHTRRGHVSCAQLRVMGAIEACRTAVLGGHLEQCNCCGVQRNAYNSCRNRHCPKCQSLARAKWLDDRQAELLPVEYFHAVFTLPTPVAAIAQQNPRVVYNLLFRVVSETLQTIARDPKHLGANIGFIAVLHTWGQTLQHHPHLHCIIPGGGLSADQDRWVACRPGFFLAVQVLSRLYRRLFLEGLQQAYKKGQLQFFKSLASLKDQQAFDDYLEPARKVEWNVYTKPPFAGPQQVLDYLGRYTHRVAISNNRLESIDNSKVAFRWKDNRQDGHRKIMTLGADEFIRRFLLHVLPDGLQRIRHYGLLANRNRAQKLELCRLLLQAPPAETKADATIDYRDLFEQLTGRSLRQCPHCETGQMVVVAQILRTPKKTYFDTS